MSVVADMIEVSPSTLSWPVAGNTPAEAPGSAVDAVLFRGMAGREGVWEGGSGSEEFLVDNARARWLGSELLGICRTAHETTSAV